MTLAALALPMLSAPAIARDDLGTRIGARTFERLTDAVSAARPGDTLLLPGIEIDHGIVVRTDRVTLRGRPGTHFRGGVAAGKAAIVVIGNGVTIEGIECSGIAVPDRNGACVRAEGRNLTLRNVYFHNSEQGVLTVAEPGKVTVLDSRFEKLGKAGRAHGIYVGGGELEILRSSFLASQDQGHEIKSRASRTVIRDSVIASLDGRDSRLVDIPNGGDVEMRGNVLQQGPYSANMALIGYGLEGLVHSARRVVIEDNLILLERRGTNRIFHGVSGSPAPVFRRNIVIGSDAATLTGDGNIFFVDRKHAGLPPRPFLPSRPELPGIYR